MTSTTVKQLVAHSTRCYSGITDLNTALHDEGSMLAQKKQYHVQDTTTAMTRANTTALLSYTHIMHTVKSQLEGHFMSQFHTSVHALDDITKAYSECQRAFPVVVLVKHLAIWERSLIEDLNLPDSSSSCSGSSSCAGAAAVMKARSSSVACHCYRTNYSSQSYTAGLIIGLGMCATTRYYSTLIV
eukprot:19991-Heterococcus_DN1.PRE.1